MSSDGCLIGESFDRDVVELDADREYTVADLDPMLDVYVAGGRGRTVHLDDGCWSLDDSDDVYATSAGTRFDDERVCRICLGIDYCKDPWHGESLH